MRNINSLNWLSKVLTFFTPYVDGLESYNMNDHLREKYLSNRGESKGLPCKLT